ncbi:MAG: hypothetical protein HHJ12_06470 [Glaciimonas sp.]|nr:hypothetical protein [Glaciimonas sp.]
MDSPITRGYVCGAIRYECAVKPLAVAYCYCTDCQKASGAQMSANVLVPKAAFKVLRVRQKLQHHGGHRQHGQASFLSGVRLESLERAH